MAFLTCCRSGDEISTLSVFLPRSKANPDDVLPTASTCFLTLNLPAYTSEAALRRNVLIAVRYGASGYSFS